MAQEIQQEALTRLPTVKAIFTKEEFWEIVRVVDREGAGKRGKE